MKRLTKKEQRELDVILTHISTLQREVNIKILQCLGIECVKGRLIDQDTGVNLSINNNELRFGYEIPNRKHFLEFNPLARFNQMMYIFNIALMKDEQDTGSVVILHAPVQYIDNKSSLSVKYEDGRLCETDKYNFNILAYAEMILFLNGLYDTEELYKIDALMVEASKYKKED